MISFQEKKVDHKVEHNQTLWDEDMNKNRSPSLSMVVLVLLIILLIQSEISYSTTFGRLDSLTTEMRRGLSTGWLVFRVITLLVVLALWLLNRKKLLFKAIILVNGLLTIGLVLNMTALSDVLVGLTSEAAKALLAEVVFMAITNILIFSIWYWIIDPPGVEEEQRVDEPWDFLFPQRDDSLPFYEDWIPRYTDYLYLAYTTSFAFSPTDVLPLTRRAKMLMLLQSAISIITLTGIAGSAINLLAGG
jgi:hypothetical protein